MKGGPFGKGRSRGGSPQGAVFLGEGRSRGGARRGAAPFGGAESHARSAWSPPQAGGLRRGPGFFANRGRGGFAPLPPGFCAGSWRPGRPFEMGKAGGMIPLFEKAEAEGRRPEGAVFLGKGRSRGGSPQGRSPFRRSRKPRAKRVEPAAGGRAAPRMPPCTGERAQENPPTEGTAW